MKVFSPFKEVRLGIHTLAEKSPAKAHLALARRNLTNTAESVLVAPTFATAAALQTGKDAYFSAIASHSMEAQAALLQHPAEYISNTFLHDPVALGAAGLAMASVGLAVTFLTSSLVRVGQAGFDTYRSYRAK